MARPVILKFIGDTTSLERAFTRSSEEATAFSATMASRVSGGLSKFGTAARSAGTKMTMGLTLPIAALGVVSIKTFMDEEESQRKLQTVMENTVGANKKVIASVEESLTKWQDQTGVLKDKLRPAYLNIIAATHDVGLSQSLLHTATDISIAKGKDLGSVSQAIAKAYNGNIGALGRLGIATKDASGKTLTFDQIMKNAVKTYGNSATNAAKTTAGQFRLFKASIHELMVSIGAALIPIVKQLADWLRVAARWFSDLDPQVQKVIGGFLVAAAVAGPLVYVIGALATVVGFLLSPIGLIIIGIAALVAAAIWLYTNWTQVWDWIQNNPALAAVGAIVAALVAPILLVVFAAVALAKNWQEVWSWMQKAASDVWAVLGPIIDDALAKFQEWLDYIGPRAQEAWGHVKDAVEWAANAVVDVVTWLAGVVETLWSAFGDDILSVLSATWDTVQTVVTSALDAVSAIIQFFIDLINGEWGAAWNDIVQIFSDVWNAVLAVAGLAWAQIKSLFSIGLTVISEVWSQVWSGIAAVASFVWGAITGGWNAVTGFLLGILHGFIGAFSGAWNGFWGGLKSAIDFIATPIYNAFSAIIESIRGAWNAFVGLWNGFQVSVDIPSVDLGPLGEIGGGTITIGLPDLPKLAAGALVTGPTLAMIGEGRGDEAVIPLSDSGALNAIGAAIASAMTPTRQEDGGVNIVINARDPYESARVFSEEWTWLMKTRAV